MRTIVADRVRFFFGEEKERLLGQHSRVFRAAAICTSWKVSEVIQRSKSNNK